MSKYVPTTGALLEIYRGYRRRNRGLIGSAPPHRQIEAEFDRWLAKVKAEALRQAAYVAGDVAPDGMGGNDWFPSEWADYVAGWLEYRAARIENGAGQ